METCKALIVYLVAATCGRNINLIRELLHASSVAHSTSTVQPHNSELVLLNNLTVEGGDRNVIIHYKIPVVLDAYSSDADYDLYIYFIFFWEQRVLELLWYSTPPEEE